LQEAKLFQKLFVISVVALPLNKMAPTRPQLISITTLNAAVFRNT
jgi:hypothetical protein